MMRLIGAALLVGGSSALGFSAVRQLDKRVGDLRGLTAGLEAMERELQWRMAPLPELLRQAAAETRGRPGSFFSLCAWRAERLEGRPFSGAWRQAAEESGLGLEPADLAVLEQLGGVLGRYDGDSQSQAIAQAVCRLERQREEAADRRARLGKVYGMLGITAGVFLIILLI